MGGWGSGRSGGRPTADASLFVDLAWMLRTRRASPGSYVRGNLGWTCRGEPSGNIDYRCDMREAEDAQLELIFNVTRQSTGERKHHNQTVQLSYTVPNFGGRRWWMHCPVNGSRVAKLYCPPGGDIFASRTAWQMGYQSQRDAKRDRPFEKLFRLQKKLDCDPGWEAGLSRPKGMWHRTFERHFERYLELDAECAAEAMAMLGRLRRST